MATQGAEMKPPDKPEGCPPQAPSADETPAASDPSVSPAARLHHPKAIAPAYALLTYTVDRGIWRRSLYLSLHSAVRAGERAERRGQKYQLTLVELVPVPATPPRRRTQAKSKP